MATNREILFIIKMRNDAAKVLAGLGKNFSDLGTKINVTNTQTNNYKNTINQINSVTQTATQRNTVYNKSLNDTASAAKNAAGQVQNLGGVIGGIKQIAAPLAGLFTFGAAVKSIADFEQAMANVKAIIQPTKQEFIELEAITRKLGE